MEDFDGEVRVVKDVLPGNINVRSRRAVDDGNHAVVLQPDPIVCLADLGEVGDPMGKILTSVQGNGYALRRLQDGSI